jgi:hypothetical protein
MYASCTCKPASHKSLMWVSVSILHTEAAMRYLLGEATLVRVLLFWLTALTA